MSEWVNSRTGCPSSCKFFDWPIDGTKQDVCCAPENYEGCRRINLTQPDPDGADLWENEQQAMMDEVEDE